MAEIDGLGQVYQKQGNTGAATWESPIEQGQTPFAYMAEDLNRKNLLNQQYNLGVAKEAEKQKADELQKAYNPKLNEKAWAIDKQRELSNDLNKWKLQMSVYMKDPAFDPRDLNDERALKAQDALSDIENRFNMSQAQEADYIKFRDLIVADQNSEKPQFDPTKSLAALNSWRDSPSINDRAKVTPDQLLVPKEKVFTTYDPVNGFDINKFGSETGWAGPTGGSKDTVLNEKGAKEALSALLLDSNGEVNVKQKDHYDWGVRNNSWDSPKEYFNTQWGKVKPQFNTKHNPEYRNPTEPKDGWDISQLQGFSDDDLRTNFQLGNGTAKVHSGAGSKKEDVVTMYNQTQLPNINATISGADAIDASTGNPIGGTGDLELKSGTISTPLVFNSTGKLVVIPKSGTYKVKDTETGEMVELSGTQQSIQDQMVQRGYASYTPMVKGTVKGIGGQNKTIYVKAKSALPNTGEKTLKGVQAVHHATEILADRMNEKAKKNVGDNTNQPTAKKSFPEWKKANPNGNITQYNNYKNN